MSNWIAIKTAADESDVSANGRTLLAMPITREYPTATILVFDMHRKRRILARWIAASIPLGLAILVGVLALGCAEVKPAPAVVKPPKIVVLSERVGSPVAALIEAATGQRPFAATVPGLPIIVFSPKDANDQGLLAHELCHKRQQADMGDLPWSAKYVRDVFDCEAMRVDRGVCLKTTPLEAECYQIQREIASSSPSRLWVGALRWGHSRHAPGGSIRG